MINNKKTQMKENEFQAKCDEFVQKHVYTRANQETEFILKSEEKNKPFCYDDIINLYYTDEELKNDLGYENIQECKDNGEDIKTIYEYWKVSSNLIYWLKKNNYPIIEEYNIMCRTTTGQNISIDYIIRKIVKELYNIKLIK